MLRLKFIGPFQGQQAVRENAPNQNQKQAIYRHKKVKNPLSEDP